MKYLWILAVTLVTVPMWGQTKPSYYPATCKVGDVTDS